MAAIALTAAIVAVAAAVVLGSRSPKTPPPSAAPAHRTQMIAYGMSKQQVRRLAGSPTSTRGSCWLYRARPVSLVQLPPPGKTPADEGRAALKICFLWGKTSGLYYWFTGPRAPNGVWSAPIIVCRRDGVCPQQ